MQSYKLFLTRGCVPRRHFCCSVSAVLQTLLFFIHVSIRIFGFASFFGAEMENVGRTKDVCLSCIVIFIANGGVSGESASCSTCGHARGQRSEVKVVAHCRRDDGGSSPHRRRPDSDL